jgi:hypothetical protein
MGRAPHCILHDQPYTLSMRRSGSALSFTAVALVCIAAAFALFRHGDLFRASYKAFYCAGQVVQAGKDPYLVQPLAACEHRAAAEPLPPDYVEPAPLPGFALAPFAILGSLSKGASAALFLGAALVATLLSAWLLAAITRAPPAAVLAVLTPLSLLNMSFGEIPIFTTFAIIVAGYGLTKQRFTLAGIAAAFSLVQPHIGIAVLCGVVLFVPQTRRAAVAAALGLAAVSLAIIGPHANLQYVEQILPAMARAELIAGDQLSLSRVLFALHAGSDTALQLGSLSYALMLLVSLAIASYAAKRMHAPELLACVPAAGVLLGGVFMHDIEILAALPAAIVIAARAPIPMRLFAFATLAVLGVLWTQEASRLLIVLDALAIAGAFYVTFTTSGAALLAPAVACAIAILAALIAIQHIQPPLREAMIQTVRFPASPGEIAPRAWGAYIRATPARMHFMFVHALPIWLGLFALQLCAFMSGRREKPLISAPAAARAPAPES